MTRLVSEWLDILPDRGREYWQTQYRVTTEGVLFGREGRRGIAEGQFVILREDT